VEAVSRPVTGLAWLLLLGVTAPPRLLAQAPVAPGPPPCMVLQIPAGAPVIGVDREIAIDLRLGPAARPPGSLPRLFASVGVLTLVSDARDEEGRLTARYTLPPGRFPQVALLAAETPSGCRAMVAVPLRAPASPAFRTDPGASVTVRVAERDFGPVTADEQGQVRVPVVVPPGVRTALARSTNAAGKVSEQAIDLAPPPFPRLVLLAPHSLVAGEARELAVAGVDLQGQPLEPERLSLTSTQGRPQPLGGQRGLGRFLVRAPISVDEGRLRLTAMVRGEPDSEIEVPVPLVPGPVATLAIRPARSRLPAAANRTTDVYVIARDRNGNAAPADPVAVYVNGRRADTRSLGDGRIAAQVSAHEALAGQNHVEVEAVLSPAYARERVPVGHSGGRLRLAAADRTRHITPRVGLNVAPGGRPGLAVAVAGSTRTPFTPAALELGLDLGYLGSRFDMSHRLGTAHVALDQLVALATLSWRFHPHPLVELGPGAGLGLAVLRARTEDLGYAVAGWQLVAPAVDLGLEVGTPIPPGSLTLGFRYQFVRPHELSNGDRLAGNAAGLVLALGYRVGL
jgi:hypothetical protein